MITLSGFLLEATANEEKLTHLEHAEDHPINAGEEGFNHTFNTLHGVHEALRGKKSKVTISTKYDGSPSVVFGHHPETGRFFVSSKSAFNVNPKLNYTHADIEKNHGHAPGLVSKLKAALEHLPKVTPTSGVYQGDFMYNKADNDVESKSDSYHFKPNTITYSAKKNSEHGEQIKNSKIGVVVHTAYHGDTLQNMKASYNADLSHFGKHEDVHLISPKFDSKKAHYTPEAQKQFTDHMQKAINANSKLGDYSHLEGHREHLKTYINSTVRDDVTPSVEGYKTHLDAHFLKKAQALKTDAGKQRQHQMGAQHLAHVDKNKKHFENTLQVHKHLQAAKNVLVNALSSHQDFHHTIGGKQVKPEGHVAVINNRPTKLVDRSEFSRQNFLARPR